MDLVPGPAATLGLCLAILFAPLVICLSHGRLRIPDARHRLVVAAAVVMLAGLLGLTAMAIAGVTLAGSDIVAGALLLVTAVWAFAVFWSLICWSFSLSLLQALRRLDRPADAEAWFQEYAGPGEMRAFTRDRLGVLLALRLAHESAAGAVTVRRAGRRVGALARLLRRYYGLPHG